MIFHWIVFISSFIVAVAGGVSKTLDTLQWGWDNTVLANISVAWVIINMVPFGMALGYVEPVLVYSLFFFVPTGLCIFFRGWHLRRAQLIENDCRVCPHCLFSLVGLSDAGTCPECGNDYEMERVRGHWTREYPSLLAPRHQGDTDP